LALALGVDVVTYVIDVEVVDIWEVVAGELLIGQRGSISNHAKELPKNLIALTRTDL
jgi:hypothetical protein